MGAFYRCINAKLTRYFLLFSKVHRCTLCPKNVSPLVGYNFDTVCLLVRLILCPFAFLKSRKITQISLNFLCMSPVAVARSSSDDSTMRYVLPVLWIIRFHIMEPMGQHQRRVCLVEFARWRQRGRSCSRRLQDCSRLFSFY